MYVGLWSWFCGCDFNVKEITTYFIRPSSLAASFLQNIHHTALVFALFVLINVPNFGFGLGLAPVALVLCLLSWSWSSHCGLAFNIAAHWGRCSALHSVACLLVRLTSACLQLDNVKSRKPNIDIKVSYVAWNAQTRFKVKRWQLKVTRLYNAETRNMP